MTLDTRRKQYLNAMGIDVWVSRDAPLDPAASLGPEREPEPEPEPLVEAQATPAKAAVAEVPTVPQPQQVVVPPAQDQRAMGSARESPPGNDFFGGEVPPLDAYANEPPAAEGDEDCFDDFLTPDDGVSKLGWEELAERVAACTCCELSKTRNKTVFGIGDRKARVMFIGEAPGQDEDLQGEPFVGRAGTLLTAMLKSIGFERDQVFIANVLKCRPPQNRDPQAEEVQHCLPYLQRQIALVEPDVLVCLGRHAVHNILNSSDSLARLRGRSHAMPGFDIPVVATYHPAYLLRTTRDKRKAWEDLLFIKGLLSK